MYIDSCMCKMSNVCVDIMITVRSAFATALIIGLTGTYAYYVGKDRSRDVAKNMREDMRRQQDRHGGYAGSNSIVG